MNHLITKFCVFFLVKRLESIFQCLIGFCFYRCRFFMCYDLIIRLFNSRLILFLYPFADILNPNCLNQIWGYKIIWTNLALLSTVKQTIDQIIYCCIFALISCPLLFTTTVWICTYFVLIFHTKMILLSFKLILRDRYCSNLHHLSSSINYSIKIKIN